MMTIDNKNGCIFISKETGDVSIVMIGALYYAAIKVISSSIDVKGWASREADHVKRLDANDTVRFIVWKSQFANVRWYDHLKSVGRASIKIISAFRKLEGVLCLKFNAIVHFAYTVEAYRRPSPIDSFHS